jgi:hypothetical protein
MIDAFDVLKITSLNSIASTSYAAKSLVQQAITELKKTDGTHLYLPGVSSTFGVSTGNYIDSAGTQVAVLDSPVGLVVDTTGVINASQSTTANKPVLTKRVNLLTKTEQFDDAGWTKQNLTVTPNTVVSPSGTTTADTLTNTATNGEHRIYQGVGSIRGARNIYAKEGTASFISLAPEGTSAVYAEFNLATGVVVSSAGCTGTIILASNGFYLCGISAAAGANGNLIVNMGESTGQSIPGTVYAGTFKTVIVWGASLTTAANAYLPYQRVNTATDYDTVGFPSRWDFDSTDSLQLTFPAGYGSATIIDATAAGQVTLTAQNITGAYNIGPSLSTNGRIILRDTPTQRQLYLYQNLAKRLAGL